MEVHILIFFALLNFRCALNSEVGECLFIKMQL